MYVPALRKLDTNNAIAMFQIFLDHGWDINSKTDLGFTVLKHIIGDERLTRWFLEHGADPNAFGKNGSTILDVAAANSTPEVFDLLVEHGAKLKDSDALHSAAMSLEQMPGRAEMMQHLLDLGMDINALWRREFPPTRRRPRITPLHAAVISQQRDRIMLLLNRGADREAKNVLGQTPMEYATSKGFTKAVEVMKLPSPLS